MEGNGKGIFYGVIGVATLIVAIIGATFAYFTAAGNTADDIAGQTATASSVGVSIAPVYPTVESGKQLENGRMVPLKTADLGTALTNKCIDANGYVACQVYKITLENKNADAVLATTQLQLTTNGISAMRWQNMDEDGNAVTGTAVDSHDAASTVASGDTIATGTTDYYVVIWLESDTTGEQTTTDAGKKFSGTVTTNIVNEDGSNLTQLEATFSTGV